MTKPSRMTIQCPCCEVTLVIDQQTGAVIWSEAKPAKPSESIDEVVRRLDHQRQATNERVAQEQRALKERARILDEKVKESMKRVDPDAKPPLRPIDLD